MGHERDWRGTTIFVTLGILPETRILGGAPAPKGRGRASDPGCVWLAGVCPPTTAGFDAESKLARGILAPTQQLSMEDRALWPRKSPEM